MNELKIVPSFHLRGIIHASSLIRYKKKEFPSIIEDKVNIAVSNIQVLPKYSQDPQEETFLFQDKSGCKDLYTTLNHHPFKEGKYKQDIPCLYCRYPIGENCVPLPLKLINGELLISEEPFCSFQCCLAGLRREQGLSFVFRDPLYKDSEHLLKYFYAKEHGEDKVLREALDWRLLDINGGPLSREEYTKENISYMRTTNIIVPVKVCYMQIKH